MQTRSFRGSGEPARVNASSNARFGLGPDPRIALGPAAIRAASTGRTHDRTRPMLHQRKEALVNQAPSTHDPSRTWLAVRTRYSGHCGMVVARHRATLYRAAASAATPETGPRAGRPRLSPSFVVGWPSRLRRCRWSYTRPGL